MVSIFDYLLQPQKPVRGGDLTVCAAGDTSCEDRSGTVPKGKTVNAPAKYPTQVESILGLPGSSDIETQKRAATAAGDYKEVERLNALTPFAGNNIFGFFSESGFVYVVGFALIALAFVLLRK